MTLSDKAHGRLRQDIASGAFAPGQPLRMASLAQRYQMGFSPLREALNRLQADRLVVSVPLKGFCVSTSSVADLSDTINTRILIETEALTLSMQQGNDSWEGLIVSSLHALNLEADRVETGQVDDPLQMERRHHAFHLALISACNSNWLLDFFERLYAESERYRHPMLSRPTKRSFRDVRAEHSALSGAVLARDCARATALLKNHYDQIAKTIKTMMKPKAAG